MWVLGIPIMLGLLAIFGWTWYTGVKDLADRLPNAPWLAYVAGIPLCMVFVWWGYCVQRGQPERRRRSILASLYGRWLDRRYKL